ncbi:MAG TPA: YcxB family protein [Actinophytocola sp.]|jgi:hypothetical protein|uniref:YcxB family protein n=1 Tax=Actinophytocola sp. TaxID=1872138 RepID=UPI002E0755E2|nr:YcxB family protein [Actinophytocola sp.]
MSSDQIELTWDPTLRDWLNGVRAGFPFVRFLPWVALAFALAGGVLLVLGHVRMALVGFGYAAVIIVLPAVMAWISFRMHPGAKTTMTGRVDEHSLLMMAVDGTTYSDLPWEVITGWAETRRGFVVRTGAGNAIAIYTVPHRAFAGPEQHQQFRELVGRRVGPVGK